MVSSQSAAPSSLAPYVGVSPVFLRMETKVKELSFPFLFLVLNIQPV